MLETRYVLIDYVSMLKMFSVYVSKLIITQDTAYFQEKLGKLQKGWTKCPNEHLGVKFKFKWHILNGPIKFNLWQINENVTFLRQNEILMGWELFLIIARLQY